MSAYLSDSDATSHDTATTPPPNERRPGCSFSFTQQNGIVTIGKTTVVGFDFSAH
jgi:hypothetical protein